jgi:hypothetical protein
MVPGYLLRGTKFISVKYIKDHLSTFYLDLYLYPVQRHLQLQQ